MIVTEFLRTESTDDIVECLYNIFLGREPEEDHPWLGESVITLLSSITASNEFSSRCEKILDSGPEALVQPIACNFASDHLAILAAIGAQPPRSKTWPDYLLSGIEVLDTVIGSKSVPAEARLVASMIADDYIASPESEQAIDAILTFDPEWFVRFNRSVPTVRSVNESDLRSLAAIMTVKGEAEISPFFIISGPGNVDLRRTIFGVRRKPIEFTLEDVLTKLRVAFRRGLLSHWLFKADYYLSQRDTAFNIGNVAPWAPYSDPYLDFLVNGDKNNIRPHWLFSPTAYAKLNSGLQEKHSCFRHFVTFGQFEEFRTSALFDVDFYRTMNSQMQLMVGNGTYTSLLESFCRQSYLYDVPFSPDFDLDFYKATNPDVVADGIHVFSVSHHFLQFGVSEGRNPNPYFDQAYVAARYPWIGDQSRKLSLSLLEYFLLIGRHENMKAARPLPDRAIDIQNAKALYERRAKDSEIRSRRHPIDFTSLLDEAPILSVIVPVHNQASFTARFLELAFHGAAELKRRSGRSMEVIVVSNGSTDSTATFLKKTCGIKYVIKEEALGYPAAANLGAELATGDLVLIVNNDIEFEPSVFADLVESYYSTPNCGAIGPRILQMDLTIQEVGAFVSGDGSSFGFDRGERSSYSASEGVEPVDYVSGCFLCLSRVEFASLGGFDLAFSPGYYEEVDLCFRIASVLDKQIFVDCSISITHYENASFVKGRPATVSHPIVLRNRKRFLTKHPRLRSRPTVDRMLGAAGLSRFGVAKSRVLVIEDLVPDNRLGSGFGRAAEVLRTFHKMGVAYDVLAVNPTIKIDEYEFSDVMLYRHWMPGESLDAVLRRSPGIYSHIWVCRSHNLTRFYENLKSYKDDWGAKVICDTEAVSVQRTIELTRLQGGHPLEDEIMELVSAEFSASAIVDHFVAVNQRDENYLRSVGLDAVSVISHTVSGIHCSDRPRSKRTRLLFVGSVHSPVSPNFDSLKWLLESVDKTLRKHRLRLTVVGYWDEATLREFRETNAAIEVEFLGIVSEQELSDLYDEAIVALAPTRYSAGIPCKVIEAMLTGTPVVMTELLADQLDVTGDVREQLAVAKLDLTGAEFCAAITRLVDDPTWWATVRAAQLAFANAKFSAEAFEAQVRSVLEVSDIRCLS